MSGPIRDSRADRGQSFVMQTGDIVHAAQHRVHDGDRHHSTNRVGLQLERFRGKRAQRLVVGFGREAQVVRGENLRHAEDLPRRA